MVRISEVSTFWMDGEAQVSVSGDWLRQFGFDIGRKVVVDVTQGVITIKVVDEV